LGLSQRYGNQATYGDDVFNAEVVGAVEPEYDEQNVEKVHQDGRPHVPEEVEYLALDNRYLRVDREMEITDWES